MSSHYSKQSCNFSIFRWYPAVYLLIYHLSFFFTTLIMGWKSGSDSNLETSMYRCCFLIYIFLMLAHKCFLSLLLFTSHISLYILSDEWALYNNRADTCWQLFNVFDGTLLSCRAEPGSPHIQLELWTPGTFVSLLVCPFQVWVGL